MKYSVDYSVTTTYSAVIEARNVQEVEEICIDKPFDEFDSENVTRRTIDIKWMEE